MNKAKLEAAITKAVEEIVLFEEVNDVTFGRVTNHLNNQPDLYGVTFRVFDHDNESITFAASKPGEEDMTFQVTYKIEWP